MYSQFKRQGNSVIIYYSWQGKKCRFNTGVKVTIDKQGKPIDWDDSKNDFKANADNYTIKYAKINKWKSISNKIIDEHSKDGAERISADLLQNKLENYKDINTDKQTSQVVELFTDFYNYKKNKFVKESDLVALSIKDYKSLLSALTDWDTEQGRPTFLNEINYVWLDTFKLWLQDVRPKGSETKGGLNNQTIKKRFETLISFFNWLKPRGLVTSSEFIRDYKRTITVEDKVSTVLSIDEIYKLNDTEFNRESLNRVRDYFVFVCLTGLRYGDFQSLNRNHIKMINNHWTIKKRCDKTKKYRIDVLIPLAPLAYSILERYNFKFPTISNQKINEYLKELLKESGLFNDDSEEIDQLTGNFKPKHEVINFHKGRDTFITNMVVTTPIHIVMKMSGHKNIEQVYEYIKKPEEVNPMYISALDRPKPVDKDNK